MGRIQGVQQGVVSLGSPVILSAQENVSKSLNKHWDKVINVLSECKNNNTIAKKKNALSYLKID